MARGRYYFPVARVPRLKKRFNYFGGEPKEDESRKAREKIDFAQKPPSPARVKEGFHSFCESKIKMKSQRATRKSRAPRLEREIVKMRLRVLTRFPKARENVAER